MLFYEKTRFNSIFCSAEAIRRSSWPIHYCMEKSSQIRTHTHTHAHTHTHTRNYCNPAAHACRWIITSLILPHRLLFTLESNACQSSFLSSKQDLSVVHCQLLMFIFHHFTKETRTSLFKACITSVIRAAQARRWVGCGLKVAWRWVGGG